MPEIFISYRRADSRATAERIYDRLVQQFGRDSVFKDVNEIRPGDSFADVLKDSLANCDILLVIIGKVWLDIRDSSGSRRLDDANDFVRLEVQTGLNRSDIRVIPLLVDGASLPERSALPAALQKLVDRQTIQIRFDPDFHRDMDDLIAAIQPPRNSRNTRRLVLSALFGLLLIMGLAWVAFKGISGNETPLSPTEAASATVKVAVNPTSKPTEIQTPTLLATNDTTPKPTPETGKSLDFPKTYAFYPVRDGVRVRLGPDQAVVAAVNQKDILRLVEGTDTSGPWLQIRTTAGATGYVASEDVKPLPVTIPLGVNINPRSQVDTPEPSLLGRITWVRFVYDVSMGTGNQDLTKAYNFYDPIIQKYADAGYKVMLIFTHQTFGEGAGYNWSEMDDKKWTEYVGSFAAACTNIADHYKDKNMVSSYQIWNEQDANSGALASIPIPPKSYSDMLTEAIRSVRDTDKQAIVLSGGLVTGPSSGASYIRDVASKSSPDTRQDGIAIHPYGRGVLGSIYANFGSITEYVQNVERVFPNVAVWFTEWGVLERQNEAASDIAQFASGTVDLLTKDYSDHVAALIWFGWSDNMYNSYGLVDRDGKPKPYLYEWFTGIKS
ncbi:MAG: TIR domain-containing protein [Anaerolineaceae bacterium]|nr:TIR domain-containing protein [Anaerolineaceae bacterium]